MIDCVPPIPADKKPNGCGTAQSVQDVLNYAKTSKVQSEKTYSQSGLNQAC